MGAMSYVYMLDLHKIFFIFFIGVFNDTMHYNIKNWVWICWSGQDSNSRRHVLHAVNHVRSPQNVCEYQDWTMNSLKRT